MSRCGAAGRRDVRLTPTNQHADGEADAAGPDDQQQHVQVQTLHQQPEEVRHDEIVEENQAGLTTHLEQKSGRGKKLNV